MTRWLLVLCGAIALAGCERAMHDMYQQPKDGSGKPDPQFAADSSQRTPPPGAIAYAGGEAADISSGRHGRLRPPVYRSPGVLPVAADGSPHARVADAPAPRANPRPITLALLQRGRQRYDIYCAACHGLDGDGDGMVVQRGFPAPPSYHTERLRHAPDSHIYDVITHGYGVMYPYADRVDPDDRWAIVAYVRALQLSRHLPAARLDAQDRAILDAGGAKR